jgi:Spirocyclase AveC-like
MATTSSVERRRPADLRADAAAPARVRPIHLWATVGALALAFITFVLIRWVTGPFFKQVPSGPGQPPTFMKVNLIFWQVVSIPCAVALIYRLALRPWLRERRIATDGLLVIAYATIWFQDPLSNYGGAWFTYNAWLVNFGSWAGSVPGWESYGRPGHMLVEPLLVIPALYVYFFWVAAVLGCRLMRAVRRRRPDIGNAGLLSACFAAVLALDLVLEGLLWMPGGLWSLPGGHGAVLNAGGYDQFTANEWIPVSLTLTAAACVRFFVDDRGRTIAERGVEAVRGGPGRRLLVRALATIGVIQVVMLCCYTIPQTALGFHPAKWPRDVVTRSYFTDHLCGAGTHRACPGQSKLAHADGG